MNSEKKLTFELNTAITALDTETGKFDEDAHREAVLPVRGKIMSHDGVFGCFIARYAIKVDFLDGVTDAEKVAGVVQSAVDWAAANGLFPIRGQKTPTAKLEQPPAAPSPRHIWAIVNFDSSLVAYLPSIKGGTDTEAFYSATKPVAEKITAIDGVTNFKVSLQGVAVQIDTEVTSADDAIAHLRTTVKELVSAEGGWFPYLKGRTLKITASTSQFV